jgi:hypothetical protein
MTQRERILAILVGGGIFLLVIQWGFNRYRDAIKTRENRITSLTNEKQKLEEQQWQGAFADRQMGEYVVRSLPGDPERAQSEYQQWLFGVIQSNELRDANVSAPSSIPVAGLYQKLSFRVTGRTDLLSFIGLLHDFYSKDYLHRIRELAVQRSRDGDDMSVTMNIDAIGLFAAGEDTSPPTEPSWRVDPSATAYVEPIMNRNLYEPPNQPPRYTGRSTLDVVVGRPTPAPLTFQDPEGHAIRYELAGTTPGFVHLDENSGTLSVESPEKQEFEVKVRAVETLLVRVVDPPPEPEPEPEPTFDDASQTVLTGLVQGRDDWTAWMNIRTRGKTLKLRVGDQFEIGSVQGKVVGISADRVELEINGRRLTLEPNGNLAEAAKRAEVD